MEGVLALVGFDGLHVLVTGGSSGIGFAAAQAFGPSGARVSLIARGRGRLEMVADEFRRPRHTRFDTADVDSMEIWLCGGKGLDILDGGSGTNVLKQ